MESTKATRINSTKPSMQPRDELLRVPGSRGQTRPLLLRTLRQGPAPGAKPANTSTKVGSDEQLPKSPVIAEFDLGAGDVDGQARKGSKHDRRSTRSSERSIDILQYYFRTPSPNTLASAFQNNEPSDVAIAAFEFGLYDLNQKKPTSPKTPARTTGHKARTSSTDKPLPLVPKEQQEIEQPSTQTKTPNHQKTYSLFPTAPSRPSIDPQVDSNNAGSPKFSLDTSTTPKAALPLSMRTRVDSGTALPAASLTISPLATSNTRPPRRPLNVRIRSSTSTASTSSPPSSAALARWSGDTMAPSLCSPIAKTFSNGSPTYHHSSGTTMATRFSSTSTVRDSPIRDSMEPWAASQQVHSFFEDDDDDGDETVPLRRKWKEGWKRGKGSLSWSPGGSVQGSTISSTGLRSSRNGRGRGAGASGWAQVGRVLLCGCAGARR